MISSLYGRNRTKINAVIADIKSDIEDPMKVKRVSGYDNVFVARTDGRRIIFSREGDTVVVTSVSAET